MRKKRGMNKKRTLLLGLSLITIILVSGTFAFTQMRQAALNPGRVAMFAGARIHDVFQNRDSGPGRDRAGNWNKDVFAENFGGTPIGVRIRFSEFLSLNGAPIIDEMDLHDPQTWIRYVASANNVHERVGQSALIGTAINDELGVEMFFGTDVTKLFMPTHNQVSRGGLPLDPAFFTTGIFVESIFNDPLIYRFAETSGRAIDATAGTFVNNATGMINAGFDDVLDILDWQSDLAIPTGFTLANFRGQTGYPAHNGMQNFWQTHPTGTRTAPRFFIDEEAVGGPRISVDMGPDGLGVTHTAQLTLTPTTVIEVEDGPDVTINGVMTMTQWLALDMPDGNFWIFDNTCENNYGWFYWNGYYAGLIPGGTATSLLLDSVTLPSHANLEHVIHIDSDFFTLYEVDNNLALDDMTDNAIAIYLRDRPVYDRVIDLPTDRGAEWCDNTPEGQICWYVLVTEDDDFGGRGNALIITQQVHGFSPRASTWNRRWNSAMTFERFENSAFLTTALQPWFTFYTSPALRTVARGFQYSYDDIGIESVLWNSGTNLPIFGVPNIPPGANPGLYPTARDLNDSRAWTLPYGNINDEGMPFILSISEVNELIPQLTTPGLARQAYDFANHTIQRDWWLRSPGSGGTLGGGNFANARAINIQGGFASFNPLDTLIGFRPALWITPTIRSGNGTPPPSQP